MLEDIDRRDTTLISRSLAVPGIQKDDVLTLVFATDPINHHTEYSLAVATPHEIPLHSRIRQCTSAKQQEDLTRRKVFELYKAAGVNVGVQIKPTKIKDAEAALSNLMDVVGIIFSFLTEDFVGGGVGLVFEAMYRTNWYSSKPFYFLVKDWEPCKGHWQGTITYTTHFKEMGSAENLHTKQSWNDEANYTATAEIPGRKDDQGRQIATVQATATERKEMISTGKGVCGQGLGTDCRHCESTSLQREWVRRVEHLSDRGRWKAPGREAHRLFEH